MIRNEASMKSAKPIGVKGITNTISLNIYQIEHSIETRVLGGFNNEKPRWRKLYTTPKGRQYFTVSGSRHYLDEFLRI